jgi:ligand-binding sensor domain-containing protein/signal transduction histidine kinase
MACSRYSVAFLCLASLIASTVSVTTFGFGQTYPFQKYTTADGLSHAAVRKVFQDSRGVLWFGTQEGVDSYDGRAFREYLKSGSDSYPVYEIFEDQSGILWLGTYGFGLIKLLPSGTAQPAKSFGDTLLQSYVTAITEDAHGTIWVGSDDGLFSFRPDGLRTRVNGLDGVGEIYALVADTTGTIWVGTHRGLFAGQVKNLDTMGFRQILQRPTRSLLLRRNGDILAGTSGGGNDQDGFVCRVSGRRPDTLLSYKATKGLIKAQSLFEDAEGVLWVGTGYGLYIIKDGGITHLQTESGLPNENIYDIMQDHEGTMWFGTENGVVKLARPLVVNYGMKEGLTGYAVLSAVQDRGGNFWVGMWNGLNRIDRRRRVTHWDQLSGLPHHTVRAIAEDTDGRILAGTVRGLAVVTGHRASHLRIRGLPEDLDIWSIFCESDNTIWVGGGGRLFETRNGAVERQFNLGEGIPGGAVEVQCRDPRGRLWVIAGGRAVHIDLDGVVTYMGGSADSHRLRMHSIYKDSRGILWFCTNKGVVLLEGDSLRLPSAMEHPGIRNPTYFVLEAGGKIWFGTDHGVQSWDGKRLSQLTTADGLASDIVTMACRGYDGALWFGTRGGISVLDSSSAAYVAPVPGVYLDSALAADGTKPIPEQATLPYEDRTVVFRFNALSFLAEREMQFQWMVEGFDKGWQAPRKERQVRYTNLGPGSYVFKARAANRNGQWSIPAVFPFLIQPPFWRTWWFIALSIGLVGSVLTIAYRFRVNQLLKMEQMRRRIAADLHDDIASSLSSVAIYAAVIQRQLRETPEDIRSLLDRIRDLSRESMDNIGLIVWSVDPRRDELTEVFRYFQTYATQLCKAAGVEFVSQLPDVVSSVLLTPEQRRTIFLIFKEALNNALRHSRCSRIDFVCALRGHALQLALTDNGCGFSGGFAAGHGLHNMRSRGESIRAHMEITSVPGKMTTVALTLRIA